MRYTDEKNNIEGKQDFIIRTRKPTMYYLGTLLAVAFMLSVILSLVSNNNLWIMIAMLFMLMSGLGWYCIMTLLRDRDMLLATEFQNALFASALGINNKFCLIIKRDGNIVYLDRMFQQMFPDFMRRPRRAVDVLLEEGQVSRADSEQIFQSIDKGVFDKLVFCIRSADGKMNKIVMTVEPILRPSGFLLLRGRDYVESRNNAEVVEPVEFGFLPTKSSVMLISSFLDMMHLGGYITDPLGKLVYVSHTLESWLGYQQGEIGSGSLLLRDLIHTDEDVKESEPVAFQGEIAMKRKGGGTLLRFVLNQQILHDENGRVVGSSAIVQQLGDASAELKKKNW